MDARNPYDIFPQAGWWNRKAEIAKGMTDSQLRFAMTDCREAARAGLENQGKYMDELSIYATELKTREMTGRCPHCGQMRK